MFSFNKTKALNYTAEEINRRLALVEEKQDKLDFDTELSETSLNPIENKAVFEQYMNSEDIEEVLNIFD